MKVASHDRGEIIHQAGLLGLSPALNAGAPVLSRGQHPEARRCGWEPFFSALEARGLEPVFDLEDPGATALVARTDARGLERHHTLREAVARSGRLLRALLRRGS
jgi:hypothetical protein